MDTHGKALDMLQSSSYCFVEKWLRWMTWIKGNGAWKFQYIVFTADIHSAIP